MCVEGWALLKNVMRAGQCVLRAGQCVLRAGQC